MNILHIFMNYGASPNYPIRKAMLNVFNSYNEIDWLDIERKHGISYLNELIKQECIKNKFDICFMQIQRKDVVYDNTVQFMRKLGIFVVNWTSDVSINTDWLEQIGKHCSLTLFTNRSDSERLTKLGIKSDYLQVSFDNLVFTPQGKTGAYGNIVFCGSNYEELSNFPLGQKRKEMVVKLKQHFKDRFNVYGSGWVHYLREVKYLNVQQESECYRSANIAINGLRYKPKLMKENYLCAMDIYLQGYASDEISDHAGLDYFNIQVLPVFSVFNWFGIGWGITQKIGLEGQPSIMRTVFSFGLRKEI